MEKSFPQSSLYWVVFQQQVIGKTFLECSYEMEEEEQKVFILFF